MDNKTRIDITALEEAIGDIQDVRARHRDGIVIEHSGYQLHIITDISPDTVVSELTRLFLDVFADPN